MGDLARAAEAIAAGELVVYPTETVYGLGADATSREAVDAVYRLKGRDRSNPLSVAVPDLRAVDRVATPSPRTRRFMEAFLPGPVTVVCPRRASLPDILTAGESRIGVRIPDHDLARRFLRETPPLTATSANPTGGENVREATALAPSIRDGVAVVLDGGKTNGEASTVVDVDRQEIHRRGAFADSVQAWLEADQDQASSP